MEDERQFVERVKRDILYGHDIAPPVVDVEKCTGCGLCVKVCPSLVFKLDEKKSTIIRGEGCNACGQCWAVCPEEAVSQQDAATATTLKPGPAPAVPPDTLQLLLKVLLVFEGTLKGRLHLHFSELPYGEIEMLECLCLLVRIVVEE